MIQPEVIVETDSFLALNKPSGMLTLPDRHDGELLSLKHWLDKKYGKIFVVHRIDRDTSGLILFAKTPEAHQHFSKLFESRAVQKLYLGIVHGTPIPEASVIDAPIGEHHSVKGKMAVVRKGKSAITHYKTLERLGKYSLVEFRIETGRTHQIRVHMSNNGNPLVADPLYGDGQPILLSAIKKRFKLSKSEEEERPLLSRLALHASNLQLKSPEGELINLTAPLSKDMEATLKQLRKWSGRK